MTIWCPLLHIGKVKAQLQQVAAILALVLNFAGNLVNQEPVKLTIGQIRQRGFDQSQESFGWQQVGQGLASSVIRITSRLLQRPQST